MYEAERIAERLGEASIRWVRGNIIMGWFELGEWDRFSPAADEFLERSEASPHYHDSYVLTGRAFVRLARGDLELALADQAAALERARHIKDPQVIVPALAASSWLLAEVGRLEEARLLFEEVLSSGPDPHNFWLETLPWAADPLDRRDEVLQRLPETHDNPRARVARSLLEQEFVEAADAFCQRDAVYWEARARLRAAEQFVAEGRRAEADEQLRRALAFYRAVGATLYIRKGEALLAESA
jgi:tetratricopeptide (TPR) repeat protein